jgi:glucan phosphoethanolaminetransferase (alkaline phosphatase superfamily)
MVNINDFWKNKIRDKKEGFILIILAFIPLQIYIVGDWLVAGVQFSFMKIQYSYIGDKSGSSVIFLTRELFYVTTNLYQGRTAFSVLLWITALFLLISAILFFWFQEKVAVKSLKLIGVLIILSAFIFLISIIAQYGIIFSGPAGTSIPIGIPLLFIVGGWFLREGKDFPDQSI